MPVEFKALITALDAVGEDNLSFEKVKGMLLNDADRSRDTFMQGNLKMLFLPDDQWDTKGGNRDMAQVVLRIMK